MAPISIPDFAAAQLALLAAEQQAEEAEASALVAGHSPTALQRAGLALTNLTVLSQRTGLGGKTVLELGPDPATTTSGSSSAGKDAGNGDGGAGGAQLMLPEHGLRTGDVVLVAEQPPAGGAKKREVRELERRGARGVVTRVQRGAAGVALDVDERKEEEGGFLDSNSGKRLWIVKVADDVTYRRMAQAMEKLQKMTEAEYSSFIRVLFGLSSPAPVPDDLSNDPDVGEGKIEWFDPSLNDSQKDAIRFALASREVALIHGPPGTGKTHTLIELILQLLKRNQRILVCGPSNISVDNIAERLSPLTTAPLVRLGHPARLLPAVLAHSLDVLTRSSDAGAIVRDVRADLDTAQAALRKARSGRERHALYGDLRALRTEFRERERRCVGTLVGGARVVLATLHGAGGHQLRGGAGGQFDVVVIDEASQALEAQCWVALLGATKVVCAGDHLQLPPTVKSVTSKAKAAKTAKTAKTTAAAAATTTDTVDKQGADVALPLTLETTLFDRLLALHGPAIKRMLTTQYRMHEAIMRFPSAALYEDRLVAAEAVRHRLLKDLPYAQGAVADTDETREPLVFIDTQGGDFAERADEESVTASAGAGGSGGGKKGGGGSGSSSSSRKALLHSDSKSNDMEAALVRQHIGRLVAAGVRPDDIAVVTPYNAQLALLAPLKDAYPGIELGSVDGFQGREKEAVVLSLVRSNADGDVGFLGDKRRLNVAMTRPKRSLTVIGDSETVRKGSKFLKDWMDFLEEQADLRYPDMASLQDNA